MFTDNKTRDHAAALIILTAFLVLLLAFLNGGVTGAAPRENYRMEGPISATTSPTARFAGFCAPAAEKYAPAVPTAAVQ